MNTEEKILDLVFHRVLPEKFIKAILSQSNMDKAFHNAFIDTAESTLYGYSGDEQALFYRSVGDNASVAGAKKGYPPFHLLVHYGEKVLRYDANSPLCKYENLLNWREMFLQLGQDIIITAWLAQRGILSGSQPKSFAWPAVILSDNTALNWTLSAGMAENHYHLYGSAAIFPISWARIMTYPDIILYKNSWLGHNQQMSYSRGYEDNLWPTKKRLILAAYIRTFLFSKVYGLTFDNKKMQNFLFTLNQTQQSYGLSMFDLRRETELLTLLYGIKFDQPQLKKSVCLDYAFTRVLSADINSHYRILAGERHLLYQCFTACFNGKFDAYTQWLFYCYLLLKSQFRSELVQTNQQTGFSNFLQYELRKRDFWKKDAYKEEAYRTAINAVLNRNNVNSLEIRVSPDPTQYENKKKIFLIDLAKLFYDGVNIPFWRYWKIANRAWEKENFFYVLHFVKEEDRTHVGEQDVYVPCRHNKQRDEYRRQAIAVAKLLSNYEYFCKRIRGIDACANEVTCRPENFACVFRFLRGFSPEHYRVNRFSTMAPRLSASYHVGEDFWDIADGLRAIDEAINFLPLHRGDRLGHALALGVEPQIHYATKSKQIILPKQNLLDNYMWLYFRCDELNVSLPSELRSLIYNQAESLLYEIYYQALQDKWPVSLSEYYHAWLLRGDDPNWYDSGGLKGRLYTNTFDFFALNDTMSSLSSYRMNPKIAYIYYCYHYSASVRRVGSQTITIDISDSYVLLMERLQEAMQRYVNSLGICIECNPSSNVLIGTFKNYGHHPILRFYKMDPADCDKASQMHVSINTDDQGIFGTSLPFEYTLLSAALAAETDDEGNRCYSDAEIKKYLEEIRQMGQQQVFPAVSVP